MAQLSLRAARASDAAHIAAIWNVEIRDGLSTFTTQEKSAAQVVAMIDTAAPFLVACNGDDDAVLGFASYGAFRGGPGYVHTVEHSIYLSQSARGQGAGTRLMDALEQAAAQAGMHVMVGALSGINTAALRFHLSRGYQQVGHLPQAGRKAGQWLDLVLVQKIVELSP